MSGSEGETGFFLHFPHNCIHWMLSDVNPAGRLIPLTVSAVSEILFFRQQKLPILFNNGAYHSKNLCKNSLGHTRFALLKFECFQKLFKFSPGFYVFQTKSHRCFEETYFGTAVEPFPLEFYTIDF